MRTVMSYLEFRM